MAHPALTEGSILKSRFLIERQLGNGSFGCSYLALDRDRFDVKCTIKQLKRDIGHDEEMLAKLFRREAKQLFMLGRHRFIPEFLGFFDEDEFHYLAYVFEDGSSLSDLCLHGYSWSAEDILHLWTCMQDALQHVHSLGLVHRDIKPSNIIKRSDCNEYALIDFGASVFQPSEKGTLIGTPGYAPLQQLVQGISRPNTDMHALAMTVIHIITGHTPAKLISKLGLDISGKWQDLISIDNLAPSLIDQINNSLINSFETAEEIPGTMLCGDIPESVKGFFLDNSNSDTNVIISAHHEGTDVQQVRVGVSGETSEYNHPAPILDTNSNAQEHPDYSQVARSSLGDDPTDDQKNGLNPGDFAAMPAISRCEDSQTTLFSDIYSAPNSKGIFLEKVCDIYGPIVYHIFRDISNSSSVSDILASRESAISYGIAPHHFDDAINALINVNTVEPMQESSKVNFHATDRDEATIAPPNALIRNLLVDALGPVGFYLLESITPESLQSPLGLRDALEHACVPHELIDTLINAIFEANPDHLEKSTVSQSANYPSKNAESLHGKARINFDYEQNSRPTLSAESLANLIGPIGHVIWDQVCRSTKEDKISMLLMLLQQYGISDVDIIEQIRRFSS